jgi:transcription elongation factor GreA-like protein
MNPDIQKAVEAGKISKSVAGILEHFTPGACVLHKNWGFGQIANIDFLINQITIDFATVADLNRIASELGVSADD